MAIPKPKKLFGSLNPMPQILPGKPRKPKKSESMETYHKKRSKKMGLM